MIHWTLDIPTLVLHVTHHLTHDMIWIFRTNVLHHILMCMCIFVCIQKEKERERDTHIERERYTHCMYKEGEGKSGSKNTSDLGHTIYICKYVCVYCTHTCYVDINVTCNVYDMWYSCPEKKW